MTWVKPGYGRLPFRNALERILSPAQAREWADEAANGLHKRTPQASARQGIEARQLIAVFAPLVFLFVWGTVWPPLTNLPLLLASIAILALSTLRLSAAILSPGPLSAPALDDDHLPIVTILAPMFREAEVLPQLVSALDRIDYPALCIKRTKR